MTEKPSGNSRKWAWALTVMVALPVFYLVTYPVVVSVTRKVDAPWMKYYMKPYKWIVNNTSLAKPLRVYDDWWIDRLEN